MIPKKRVDVNLIVDYFHPVNKSHIKVAQKLYEETGSPSIFVAVSKISDRNKYPLPKKLITSLLRKTQAQYPDIIKDIIVIPDGKIETIFDALGSEYTPTLLAGTTKRVSSYAISFGSHIEKKHRLANKIKNIKLVEVDQNEFGDNLRECMITKNQDGFKSMTPRAIHKDFFTLAEQYTGSKITEPETNELKLEEHFKFLKMVVNEDSSVAVLFEGLNRVKRQYDSKTTIDNIKKLLLARNIAESDINSFFDEILNDSSITNKDITNLEYLVKNGIKVNDDQINIFKLNKIFASNGISLSVLDKVINHKLSAHDNSGTGEFASSLLFKNAIKLGDGDISIKDKKIEVKNNESQLLSIKAINESSTFTESSVILRSKLRELKEMIRAKTDSRTARNLIALIDSRAKVKRNFNINQKGLRNFMLLFHIIKNKVPNLKPYKLHEWFVSLFWGGILNEKSKLLAQDRIDLIALVEQVFESGYGIKDLLGYLTFITFKYYSRVEDFSGMMVFRNNNEETKHLCVYLPESVTYEEYDRYIEPVTGPSLTDPRTSKSFKIRLRPSDK